MLLGNAHFVFSQSKNANDNIFLIEKGDYNTYVEFFSTDIKDFFKPEESNTYPSINLFDGDLKSCWVLGSTNKLSNSVLLIKVPEEIPIDKLILNICSGYAKSKSLYLENARPKKIEVSIFAAYNSGIENTEVASKYKIVMYSKKRQIILKDTFGIQSFPLNFDEHDLINFRNNNTLNPSLSADTNIKKSDLSFIIKLEVKDIYRGSKYNDICISEIFFNNRFITQALHKLHPTDSVYIQNDNTLVVDYQDGKSVIIYKDTSSTFTLLVWNKHSKWAILHYVKNDELGTNSRNEELYLLFDLENMKTVNTTLQKCTGIYDTPLFLKDNKGNLYIDNNKYNIQLK